MVQHYNNFSSGPVLWAPLSFALAAATRPVVVRGGRPLRNVRCARSTRISRDINFRTGFRRNDVAAGRGTTNSPSTLSPEKGRVIRLRRNNPTSYCYRSPL